jgi:hypothetical protein
MVVGAMLVGNRLLQLLELITFLLYLNTLIDPVNLTG